MAQYPPPLNYFTGINYNNTFYSSSFYVSKSGDTMTGKLITPSIDVKSSISSPSIIYNGSEISSVYSTTTATNSAITTALTPYSTTTSMNNAISTALTPYSTTTSMNNAISTALTPYLQKAGDTMTGILNITTTNTTNNQIIIKSTSALNYASIQFQNNNATADTAFIGIGCTGCGGNYANNLFLEAKNSMIFQTGGQQTTETPKMIINNSGNVGIGTIAPGNKLDVRGLMNIEGLAIVDGTTYTNQYQMFITAPTTDFLPGSASIQTMRQNFGFGQNLNIQTATGSTLRLGTTTTNSQINLNGLKINGTDGIYTLLQTNLNTDISLCQNSANTTGGNISMTTFGAAGFIDMYTNATRRLKIYANGNIHVQNNLSIGGTAINTNTPMTIYSDSTTKNGIIFFPSPYYINNTNGANLQANLISVACSTTGTPISTVLSSIVNDGWNGIDTSTILECVGNANSGYNFSSKIILDGSYATNQPKGTSASTINFQNIQSGAWTTNFSVGTNTINCGAFYTLNDNLLTSNLLITSRFSTSAYNNNIVMKNILVSAFSNAGGTYNNGYYVIDVLDYTSQAGLAYLWLNLQSSVGLYWCGRIVIANSNSLTVYPDFFNSVQLTLANSNGRLSLIVQSPLGTGVGGLIQLNVKIMG